MFENLEQRGDDHAEMIAKRTAHDPDFPHSSRTRREGSRRVVTIAAWLGA